MILYAVLKRNVSTAGCWTEYPHTLTRRAVNLLISNLRDCQAACFNNNSCTGVDFFPPPSQSVVRCWLAGTWSGETVTRRTIRSTHYTLNRDCQGEM